MEKLKISVLKVNGTVLPTPSDSGLGHTDEDFVINSYRDGAGNMHKTTVARSKKKIECKWDRLYSKDLALIKSVCKPSYGEFITLEYFDISGISSMTCYSGDLKYTTEQILSSTNALFKDVSISFVQN